MSMSKKEFIALANMLRTARMGYTGGLGADYKPGHNPFQQEHLEFLADFCESQNPNFNRSRWLSYIAGECGPNGGAIKTKIQHDEHCRSYKGYKCMCPKTTVGGAA